MSAEILVNDAAWQAAVSRLVDSSSRDAALVLRGEMAKLVAETISVMPPASRGVQGRDATKQGRAAVKRDISSLYGTASDAFEIIKAKDPILAKAFWKRFSAGDLAGARLLFHAADPRSFEPFDGGSLHRRFRGGKNKARAKAQVYFVTDKKALADYVRDTQRHVYWLAAGWGPAARDLNAQVPAAVSAHSSAPGSIKSDISAAAASITATNAVKFASSISDMTRRVQWALDRRVGALDRAFQDFITKKAARAGFVTS